jgi:hypothetical protein
MKAEGRNKFNAETRGRGETEIPLTSKNRTDRRVAVSPLLRVPLSFILHPSSLFESYGYCHPSR